MIWLMFDNDSEHQLGKTYAMTTRRSDLTNFLKDKLLATTKKLYLLS